MKLAIVTPGFLPVPAVEGGAVEQLITNYIEENEVYHYYDIDLFTVKDSRLDNFNYKYTNIIQVPTRSIIIRIYYHIRFKICRLFTNGLDKNYMDRKIAKLCNPYKYDKVLIENNMNIFNLIAKKTTKNNIYFHLHNDFGKNDPAKSLNKTKRVIKKASNIIVVSDFLANKLKKLGAEKVSVVYNTIDFSKYHSLTLNEKNKLRNKYGLSNDDIVFTYIGRLEKEKGFDRVVTAFNYLKKSKNSPKIKCLVVGDNKKQRSVNNPLIHYTGYIENKNISKIYSISDCIIIPTRVEEAFGMVALESLTMGLPIIASKSGALPELLNRTSNILIDNNDNFAINLEKNVVELSKDKDLRIQMEKSSQKKSKKYKMSLKDYYIRVSNALTE